MYLLISVFFSIFSTLFGEAEGDDFDSIFTPKASKPKKAAAKKVVEKKPVDSDEVSLGLECDWGIYHLNPVPTF